METNHKSELYALQNQILYLKKVILELETELYKIRCTSKSKQPSKSTKKSELVFALSELRKKSNKTQKDKDNIYLIEMVLKNMK